MCSVRFSTAIFIRLATVLISAMALSAAHAQTLIRVPEDVISLNSDIVESNTTIEFSESGDLIEDRNPIQSPGGAVFQVGSSDGTVSNVELNVRSGSPGSVLASRGSRVNLFGGSDGRVVYDPDSSGQISGGLWYAMSIGAGADVTLSGGHFASPHWLFPQSNLNIRGGDFRLNNIPIEGLENVGDSVVIPFENIDALTGTLEEGDPLLFQAFTGFDSSISLRANITLVQTELPDPDTSTIVVPGSPLPVSLHPGQTLRIVGEQSPFELAQNRFGVDAMPGSRIEVLDGSLGNVNAVGADIDVRGGAFGLRANYGTETRLSGGLMDITGAAGSRTIMTGGNLGLSQFFQDAELVLVGSEFTLNGAPIDLDSFGDAVGLTAQGDFDSQILRGTLADGTALELEVGDSEANPAMFSFDTNSTITLRHPFPEFFCDVNGDSTCNADDITAIYASSGSDNLLFDLDYNGIVDPEDAAVWRANFGNKNFGRPLSNGDINLDGVVDSTDLGELLNSYGSDSAGWGQGNINGDLVVDSRDLGLVLNDFGSGALAAGVPEPGSVPALLIAVCWFVLWRRDM